jgi:transcriptional regulator with XRE-family HTH domain
MTFGEVIAQHRKRLHLSQKELAEKIRKEDGAPISPQYLNDIEHNRRGAPSSYLMLQFAKALGVPRDFLEVVAGQLPEDLRRESHEPEKVAKALRAYRRAIDSR